MGMSVLPACGYHMHDWYMRGQKRTPELLKLKLQMTVIHHVSAENWTWVYLRNQVLLTAESSLQTLSEFKKKKKTI